MDIGDVDFDRRQFHGEKRVHDGDGCGGVAGRIDNDGACVLRMRLLNPVDELTFTVWMAESNVEPETCRCFSAELFHVGESRASIFLGLAGAEQVHIWSIKDV